MGLAVRLLAKCRLPAPDLSTDKALPSRQIYRKVTEIDRCHLVGAF